MASESLRLARAYVAGGLSVIPIARGTKEPAAHLLPRVDDETISTARSGPAARPPQGARWRAPSSGEDFNALSAILQVTPTHYDVTLLVL